ncbi:hypothetical protein H6P81_003358 [Aristolochia fimbriata]|uniref:Transposase-associated domain-containing protein n=1 Tax=Aristolochia fimbriata TaxID=158543 RepID=A0AAV7FCC6_ARIFI|nr:hypothetical protein H6P81_003358 [Aristolochia fimbriata]
MTQDGAQTIQEFGNLASADLVVVLAPFVDQPVFQQDDLFDLVELEYTRQLEWVGNGTPPAEGGLAAGEIECLVTIVSDDGAPLQPSGGPAVVEGLTVDARTTVSGEFQHPTSAPFPPIAANSRGEVLVTFPSSSGEASLVAKEGASGSTRRPISEDSSTSRPPLVEDYASEVDRFHQLRNSLVGKLSVAERFAVEAKLAQSVQRVSHRRYDLMVDLDKRQAKQEVDEAEQRALQERLALVSAQLDSINVDLATIQREIDTSEEETLALQDQLVSVRSCPTLREAETQELFEARVLRIQKRRGADHPTQTGAISGMDKSWMQNWRSRLFNKEYKEGVKYFMQKAQTVVGSDNKVRCPCRVCANGDFHSLSRVEEHLFVHGMLPSYTRWVFHGVREMIKVS